uniref:OTU deubiquitinase with linear linkage specificity a n=2 Tax=Lepisosteus oculatus TaxID=7918 RepID=W5MZT7_LEPOC
CRHTKKQKSLNMIRRSTSMAWVKAIPSGGEDVFDEDVDDLNLEQKEWKCNMEKRVKDGYRDGVDTGKGSSLQRGFNIGYREGATRMVAIGQLKGIMSALQWWCQLKPSDPNRLTSVRQLLQSVIKQEESMLEGLSMVEQPANVGDITEIIEDMGMGQPKSGCSDSFGDTGCSRTGEQQGDSGTRKSCGLLSSAPSSTAEQTLAQLVKSCADLVEELGLPEELLHHLHQLGST